MRLKALILIACVLMLLVVLASLPPPVWAQEVPPSYSEPVNRFSELFSGFKQIPKIGGEDWHYGGYLDLGYVLDFNQPANDRWRSKATTFKVNDPKVNMVTGYLGKDATPQSRWGISFGVQGGVDTEELVPESPPKANDPISGADTLRHFSQANASYLMPVGNGLRLTGGLINSYIGYESFHAKDNANYTRGYLLDNVPYFLFGLEASYPVNEKVSLGFYAVTGYNYLANPNDLLSYGFQAVWQTTPRLTFTQNVYYGPDQNDTELEYWRFFSDSIVEWNNDRFLVAMAYDVGTEKQASVPGHPQFLWMAAALWTRWQVHGPWSVGLRPELYWDQNGLLTGAEQFIKAVTTTLEYKIPPIFPLSMQAKLEYRYDQSSGSGRGFFKGADNRLVRNQHLLIFALMWFFDA